MLYVYFFYVLHLFIIHFWCLLPCFMFHFWKLFILFIFLPGSRHIPSASGRILAERFYVIGTLRSNFLLHKKSVSGLSPETDFFIAYFFSDQISVLFASETFFYKNYNCYDCCQKNNHEWKNRCIISCLNCSLSCRIWRTRCLILC